MGGVVKRWLHHPLRVWSLLILLIALTAGIVGAASIARVVGVPNTVYSCIGEGDPCVCYKAGDEPPNFSANRYADGIANPDARRTGLLVAAVTGSVVLLIWGASWAVLAQRGVYVSSIPAWGLLPFVGGSLLAVTALLLFGTVSPCDPGGGP